MDGQRLQDLARKARAELDLLYEIGNAMRTTLKLDQILFIILTSVTSHEGLSFNRAMLFLINDKERVLEGTMGIGPDSGEEAARIWREIESQRWGLDELIAAYDQYKARPPSQLDKSVKQLRIPTDQGGGMVGRCAADGLPCELSTEEANARAAQDPVIQALRLEACVAVPIRAKDRVVGVIVADNYFTKQPIDRDDVRIFALFADHAGLAIENSRLYEQTLLQAHQDSLTHLWNHGYFQTLLGDEVTKAVAAESSVSLLMADIDDFKRHNDTLGHQVGDEVIKTISQLIRESCRKGDHAARYGGEEFAVILPNTPKPDARAIAERLRHEVEQRHQPTISIGVATAADDARTKEDLIRLADQAMLSAKRAGKNRVHLA